MDTAALRQAFPAVPIMPARPDVVAPRDAVATELPAGQSVGSRGRRRPFATTCPTMPRHSPDWRSIFNVPRSSASSAIARRRCSSSSRSTRKTGDVILQLPDQSLLNLRAYLKEQQEHGARGREDRLRRSTSRRPPSRAGLAAATPPPPQSPPLITPSSGRPARRSNGAHRRRRRPHPSPATGSQIGPFRPANPWKPSLHHVSIGSQRYHFDDIN